MFNINTQIIEDLPYDCEDMANGLLSNVLESEREQFDREAIVDAVYYIKACAENPYNHDFFRAFYNLLQTINENSYVPF